MEVTIAIVLRRCSLRRPMHRRGRRHWASNPGHWTINVVHKNNSHDDGSRRRGGKRKEGEEEEEEKEDRGDNEWDEEEVVDE